MHPHSECARVSYRDKTLKMRSYFEFLAVYNAYVCRHYVPRPYVHDITSDDVAYFGLRIKYSISDTVSVSRNHAIESLHYLKWTVEQRYQII